MHEVLIPDGHAIPWSVRLAELRQRPRRHPVGVRGEAAHELAAYRTHAPELVARDTWVLVFGDQCSLAPQAGHPLMIADPDRHAWVAFRDVTQSPETLDRGDGATFLFTRGGGLQRYWHGSGHVHDVLKELQTPAFQHRHEATLSG